MRECAVLPGRSRSPGGRPVRDVRTMSVGRHCRRAVGSLFVLTVFALPACKSALPSAGLNSRIHLPVPASSLPPGDDLSRDALPEDEVTYVLTARRLITLAFDMHPDIKSSYQRFKSEEARYDFFYVSRDSLTPRLSLSNNFSEDRADEMVVRDRTHRTELSVEKRFFDTTELNLGVGFQSDAADQAIGDHPFISANLRYPLWASRERLERTSDEIFRRNELNDAQLAYIQVVRSRISSALYRYYNVAQQGRTVGDFKGWQRDLLDLARRMDEIHNRDVTLDRERVQAEITRVAAEVSVSEGWYDVQTAHLKLACGIPFEARVEIKDDFFNPFEGATQEELLKASVATDPEIATLRNAMENAQAQLDLARRGKWDLALLMSGESSLEGRAEDEGRSDWSATVGVEISAVDSRVTDSLIRQAEANIGQFREAISARERAIFVDTLEPLIRLDTIGASRDELISNLPRYEEDYRKGVEDYLAGTLNIDDLIKRREDLYYRQQNINSQTYLLGANVTQLCTATGKFFELLDQHIAALQRANASRDEG
jgi:outer membrane protein TolC